LRGNTVFPGHLGTIYKAHNGRLLGRTKARTLRLLPDGTVFSERNLSKVRARDQGWAYAAQLLCDAAARLGRADVRPPSPGAPAAELRAWAGRAGPLATRPLRHPGNLKYAWALGRGAVLPDANVR